MEKQKPTIRELVEEKMSRVRSDAPQQLIGKFLRSGELNARLRSLSDRQVGQLMFDSVGDEFAFGTSETAICNEATQRLFRSLAGARCEGEELNLPDNLPHCPKCGEPMMHFIGIDEPDYRQCVSLVCGHKIEERNG